jgi:hypothetical protein
MAERATRGQEWANGHSPAASHPDKVADLIRVLTTGAEWMARCAPTVPAPRPRSTTPRAHAVTHDPTTARRRPI